MIITFEKFKDFQNQWVAINEATEEIVAFGKYIGDVQKKAEEVTDKDTPIVLKFIYPLNAYLSPAG
ncbi:hypothetical protein HYW83_06680 [Candidatus Peregrinibacteria bacterium]|nr:hypothetical protein [Candidatus Peregrinibacteria bacterium]